MFEFGSRKLTTVVAGGMLAGVALTGCGGSSAPKALKVDKSPVVGPRQESPHAGVLHCTADQPDKWETTPTNFKVAALASQLGVSNEAITKGKFGGATCDEFVTASQTVGTTATVEKIGQLCAVVGLGTDPRLNQPTHKILAICAADAQIGPNA